MEYIDVLFIFHIWHFVFEKQLGIQSIVFVIHQLFIRIILEAFFFLCAMIYFYM